MTETTDDTTELEFMTVEKAKYQNLLRDNIQLEQAAQKALDLATEYGEENEQLHAIVEILGLAVNQNDKLLAMLEKVKQDAEQLTLLIRFARRLGRFGKTTRPLVLKVLEAHEALWMELGYGAEGAAKEGAK